MQPVRWMVTGLALAGLLSVAHVPATRGEPPQQTVVSESFSQGPLTWETTAGEWSQVGGQLVGRYASADSSSLAFPRGAPLLDAQTVEASVVVRERLATAGWSLAGIAIYSDPDHYWLLGLTEDAQGRRYVDFLENRAGIWQAQSASATRLEPVGPHQLAFTWTPGSTYRLRIDLDHQGILGKVTDPRTGATLARAQFAFGKTDAVRVGVAGLLVRGCSGAFDDMVVSRPAGAEVDPLGRLVQAGPLANIAVLRLDGSGATRAPIDRLTGALRTAGFGVTFLSGEQLTDPRVLLPHRFFLLLLPECETYPAGGSRVLTTYLRHGGHLLTLGGPAFTRPVWRKDGQWLDRAGIRERISKVVAARKLFDFEGAPVTWPRATDHSTARGGVATASPGAAGTGHCLRVWTDALTGWNTHATTQQEPLFAPGHELLCFWARGDEQTPEMLMEVGEADGSRWMAVVPLTTRWTYHVLGPEAFQYWSDSATRHRRGHSGDRLQPREAVRLVIGLARSHSPDLSAGPHTFWLDELGTAANPLADLATSTADDLPPLETIFPSYKTYPLENVATLRPAPMQGILDASWTATPTGPLFSAIARPAGRGYGNRAPWRWVPLVEARDATNEVRGYPAWLLLNQASPYRPAIFAAFAIRDPATDESEAWRSAIVETVRRMRSGLFLDEGGARHYSVRAGEQVELGATASNRGTSPTTAVLRIRVAATREGPPDFAAEETIVVRPGETRGMTRTWNPGSFHGNCEVVTELVVKGKTIDCIAHSLGFLTDDPPSRTDFVSVQGSRFMVGGQPWYPVGINYWPLYSSGLEPNSYSLGWSEPGSYDPEEVERDLQRMQRLGINMVSIQLGTRRSLPNLLDFLRRCRNHGVRINGFLANASPVGFNETEVADFLRAGKLADNPVLFAYDIIWEPGNWMFSNENRGRWDREWEHWIVERYGSLENAESDWGRTVPRAGGKVTSPSDQQLREDGPWRVLVAAYRRFMDDLMSRKWNDAVTRLRALDPNHLLSFRQGNTLPHDFALTAPVKHIDFICLEGYSIPPGEDGYNSAGFLTRYVAFTTRGKPIYWAEFGRSVWDGSRMRPDPAALEGQASYLDLFYRVTLDAGAVATAPWWWPGGYRVDEKSDFGIINPDGTPRPAAQRLARFAPQLLALRLAPQPSDWFNFDRDTHAGGYWWAAFHEGASAYARAHAAGHVLGVRSPGTASDSSAEPVIAVGNRPYNGHNPPKYLDAEFNRLQVLDRDGQWREVLNGTRISVASNSPVRARASVGNIQEAAWLPPTGPKGTRGGVFLGSAPGSTLSLQCPISRETPYLADADLGEFVLASGIQGEARVMLRMNAGGHVWFGETRDFTVTTR